MINPDDLDPPRPAAAKPRDLQSLSVRELKAWIAEMEADIERARRAIAEKEKHRSAVDSLFGR